MPEYKTIHDLDDAGFRLKCAVDVIGVIHTAMECGAFQSEEYRDALYGAYDHLRNLCDEIRMCVEGGPDGPEPREGAAV